MVRPVYSKNTGAFFQSAVLGWFGVSRFQVDHKSDASTENNSPGKNPITAI